MGNHDKAALHYKKITNTNNTMTYIKLMQTGNINRKQN